MWEVRLFKDRESRPIKQEADWFPELVCGARRNDISMKGHVTLLFRILKVPGSNFGTETGYCDEGLCGFPQSLQMNNFWNSSLKLGHDHFFPNPLQSIVHLSPYCLMLCSMLCTYWKSIIK
jgi:hypothetical protein